MSDINKKVMLVEMFGIAAAMGGNIGFHSIRNKPKRFSWEESFNNYERDWKRKQDIKRRRQKRQARKNKRGF